MSASDIYLKYCSKKQAALDIQPPITFGFCLFLFCFLFPALEMVENLHQLKIAYLLKPAILKNKSDNERDKVDDKH